MANEVSDTEIIEHSGAEIKGDPELEEPYLEGWRDAEQGNTASPEPEHGEAAANAYYAGYEANEAPESRV